MGWTGVRERQTEMRGEAACRMDDGAGWTGVRERQTEVRGEAACRTDGGAGWTGVRETERGAGRGRVQDGR